jgi:hypothetical protein
MVQIGSCLQDPKCPDRKQLSLDLAHAIREESADAWNVLLPKLNHQ